ncbi:MAG: acyltransferase [Thermodesulfobacteriota bacterium]
MLRLLPGTVRGIIGFIAIILNTFFCCIPFFTVALLKITIPHAGWRQYCTRQIITISSFWILMNSITMRLLHTMSWKVTGLETLDLDKWYLVISNHQAWTDIVVLQTILRGRVPFLKFFLKKELMWVPVMGMVWWAQDYPFMKRYSQSFLKKNPHLKGKDLEITRKACEKFKQTPISVMNFIEGTRFTPQKHARQQSTYTHLLRPKAGGISYVLRAMGDRLDEILNIVIVYPGKKKRIWDLMCGRIPEIRVNIERIPVTANLLGDYAGDPVFQKEFQTWLNRIWAQNDHIFDVMMTNDIPPLVNQPAPFFNFPKDFIQSISLEMFRPVPIVAKPAEILPEVK